MAGLLENRFRRVYRAVRKFLNTQRFTNQGQTFWRQEQRVFPTIILRRSRWNTQEECEFWFDLGVFIPEFIEILYNEPPPPHPREGFLAVLLSLDEIPERPRRQQTTSWYLRTSDLPAESDEQIIQEVLNELEQYAVPFLTRFRALSDVAKYLEEVRTSPSPPPRGIWPIVPNDVWLPVYLGILYWMMGDSQRCLRELERALTNEEAGAHFVELVESLRQRL